MESGTPSVFLAGDFSTSFSSGLDFSGDLGFRTVFFSLSAVLTETGHPEAQDPIWQHAVLAATINLLQFL